MTQTRQTRWTWQRPLVRDALTGDRQQPAIARRVVESLGGRDSAALGIDVDAGQAQVELWFLAAALSGARLPARTAYRTFGVLERAGVVRIRQVRHIPPEELLELLDRGGHRRYDGLTATLLRKLSNAVHERYDGQVCNISKGMDTYEQLRQALDALPGWGPRTGDIFLREMRGTWPAADPPMDPRALRSAEHLGLSGPSGAREPLARLLRLATAAGVDVRDLEGSLIRLTLIHRRGYRPCDGGGACVVLNSPATPLDPFPEAVGRPAVPPPSRPLSNVDGR